MILEKLHTTENINNESTTDDYDLEILHFLVERYGIEALINHMNDIDIQNINEVHSYYGTSGGDFSQTGGYKVKGLKGLIQSLPSFAITAAVSWPAALLSAIGALSHRFQKKYDDSDSWLNRLNPNFWTDYLATSHKDKKASDINTNKDKDNGFIDKAKTALGIGGAAGTGAAIGSALSKDNEPTREDIKNVVFKEYWYTLSNGEVLRVRSDTKEHATMFINLIISYSRKTYDKLNMKISANCPRYTFFFDDGEICFWSAPTKDQAHNEAIATRKELADIFNKSFNGLVTMDEISIPEIESFEISKTNKIPVPVENKFINITTTKPPKKIDVEKKLLNPVYEYGSLEPYTIAYANFSFNVPAMNEIEAIEIIRELNKKNEIIETIYERMTRRITIKKVVMPDSDYYYIPGNDDSEIKELAIKLWKQKISVIQNTLKTDYKTEFIRFLEEYGSSLSNFSKIKIINKTEYIPKKGDEARIKRRRMGDDDAIEKVKTFKM